tara:strand:+ start:1080 stop:1583 length:504 start_codon:yes stop_codon:yes gene_type:complete
MKLPIICLACICKALTISQFKNERLPTIRRVAYDDKKYDKDIKSFMIDIDGTICKTKDSNYHDSTPIIKHIKLFNELYDKGHEIHYWTARGANSGLVWDYFTILQLKEWNVKYTSLNMGKPHYDVWIDDKAINADNIVSYMHYLKYNMSAYDECIFNSNNGCEGLLF